MAFSTSLLTRRSFLQASATLPLLILAVARQPNQPIAQAAQLTPTDGYGLGTYNEGVYPTPQYNIYLPLITKGA